MLLAIVAGTVLGAITKKTAGHTKARKASDAIELINTSFYTQETTDMYEFLEKMNGKNSVSLSELGIHTAVNADMSFTTGNMDSVENIDDVLPNYNMPYSDEQLAIEAKEHFNRVDSIVKLLNLDLYSEDPGVFLGDNESYFRISRKRGLIFFYLYRIILYGSLIMLFFTMFMKQRTMSQEINNEQVRKQHRNLMWGQWILMGGVLLMSLGMVFYMVEPTEQIDNASADFLYGFRKINLTAHNISETINEINELHLELPGKRLFGIGNIIQASLPDVQQDVISAQNFSENMLRNPSLTNYSYAFLLFFVSILLIGLNIASVKTKDSKFQVGVFLASCFILSYSVYNLGQFFSNYSTLHDICRAIKQYSGQELPESGVGLITFVGCSKENNFFHQLVLASKAQSSALKLFNFEVAKLNRAPVPTKETALQLAKYLLRIDQSTVEINTYSDLIVRLDQLLVNLLSISKCNLIREWVSQTEVKLCYGCSKQLLNIFWLNWIIITTLVLLLFASLLSIKVLGKIHAINVIQNKKLNRERFNNEVRIE